MENRRNREREFINYRSQAQCLRAARSDRAPVVLPVVWELLAVGGALVTADHKRAGE